MNKKVVIIGAGGHGKAIANIIEQSDDVVYGFLDDNLDKVSNYKILGKIEKCEELYDKNSELEFIIAIGNNDFREKIYNKYKLKYYIAIHPSANISNIDVKIEEGTMIMANVCINSSTKVGKHAIINTGTIIEHDSIIEEFAHISYGCILGANVSIGKKAYIGLGSLINIGKVLKANEKIECGTVLK